MTGTHEFIPQENAKDRLMKDVENFQKVEFFYDPVIGAVYHPGPDQMKRFMAANANTPGFSDMKWMKPLEAIEKDHLNRAIEERMNESKDPDTAVKIIYAQAGFELGQKQLTQKLWIAFIATAAIIGTAVSAMDNWDVIDPKAGWDALIGKKPETEVPLIKPRLPIGF